MICRRSAVALLAVIVLASQSPAENPPAVGRETSKWVQIGKKFATPIQVYEALDKVTNSPGPVEVRLTTDQATQRELVCREYTFRGDGATKPSPNTVAGFRIPGRNLEVRVSATVIVEVKFARTWELAPDKVNTGEFVLSLPKPAITVRFSQDEPTTETQVNGPLRPSWLVSRADTEKLFAEAYNEVLKTRKQQFEDDELDKARAALIDDIRLDIKKNRPNLKVNVR